jgi:hypothetical protein
MEKKKTSKYGFMTIMGVEIPKTKSGKPNKTYLPKEVRVKLEELENKRKELETEKWIKEIDNLLD